MIPSYNEEGCLENTAGDLARCFKSNGINLELVLVDNGSTDRTGQIIDEIVRKDPSIVKVEVKVNAGYGNGIHQGLNRCSAPVIGYLCAVRSRSKTRFSPID